MKKVNIYNKTDVELWLGRAQNDILWAKSSFRSGFYSPTCFISQQIAEKSLKALVISTQKDFIPQEIKNLRTHNLKYLVEFVEKKGVSIPKRIRFYTEGLNEYYLPTRYPDIPDPVSTYTKEIASDALEKAEEILKFVEENLELRK